VEDVNFNRLGVALGRQPIANNPTQSPGRPGVTAGLATAGYGAAGNTAYGAAGQYGNLGRTYGDATAGIASAGVQLGTAAYDLWNRYQAPAATNYGNYSMSTPSTNNNPTSMGQPAGWDNVGAYAEGGPVDAPMLGRGNPAPGPGAPMPGGRVSGPPGRDRVPAVINSPDGQQYDAALTDNEYVIPADVVRQVGTDPLDRIIEQARANKMKASNPNTLSRSGGM
jgi:hypothetical protein